jgi:mono/diheme cytochrome c family protein
LDLPFGARTLWRWQQPWGRDWTADAAGRKLVEQWCAKCHDINKGAPFKLNPPSIASIAAYRPSDFILGRIITPSAHSGMPDTLWTPQRKDFDNPVAYINTLAANYALNVDSAIPCCPSA